jgi:hypothetical protein
MPMQLRLKLSTLVGVALLGCPFLAIHTGCKGSQLGEHRWGGSQYGQGSVERQKNRAVYFDPFPLNDIGPEVVGGRPREFQNPMPEASRNELKNPLTGSAWQGYQR